MVARRITGHVSSLQEDVIGAFLAGFRECAEVIGRGELLEENHALHAAFLELEIGQKNVIALRGLLSDISLVSALHEDECRCGICAAVRKYDEAVDGNT